MRERGLPHARRVPLHVPRVPGRVRVEEAVTRELLRPADATNEGARRLRELLRRRTFGALARLLACDERAVRLWAREACRPSLRLRLRAEERLSIPADSWDEAPDSDVYDAGNDPPTERKR